MKPTNRTRIAFSNLVFQMIPVFASSLHFQLILMYSIINIIELKPIVQWANFYSLGVSSAQLVLPSTMAVVVASKIKEEVRSLLFFQEFLQM